MVNSTATTVSGHGGSFTRGFNEMTRYKGTNQNEADYYKVRKYHPLNDASSTLCGE